MSDLISQLHSRGCGHLLLLILSHLNSWDLTAFGAVSEVWADIVRTVFWPERVVRLHLTSNKLNGIYSAESFTLEK